MIKKKYTEEQEKLARFAKAMGHPARIAILQFLASQECCFFGDIHEVLISCVAVHAFQSVPVPFYSPPLIKGIAPKRPIKYPFSTLVSLRMEKS